jgi:hypothetical protein
MKQRCTYPGNKHFSGYGGRGITICERWLSFENFLADMGVKPPGTSIDRIDSNGNYEPGNCRWANATTQARNRSFCKLNPDSVNEIRGRYEHGERQLSLARRFGVSLALISMVVTRKLWDDVP